MTASSVTDELASRLSSRLTARETLDGELFSAAAQADLVSLLTNAVRKVASDAAGDVEPGQLDAFPVLATYLDVLGAQWQSMSRELAARLRSDFPELASRLNGGQALGHVTRIHGQTGDRHRHGRQVVTLEFESEVSIVYKPRDVGPEQAFGGLLHWLSATGAVPAYRTPEIIRCIDYGWSEFIEARPPANEPTLWLRIGGLLAVLDLLNARDCHWQNVIVAGDQPVLIDAEGLFHRALLREPPGDSGPEPTPGLSVLATGLTPYWKRGDDDEPRESSGAGSPQPERIKNVLDGFSRVYRSLLAGQSELLDPEGPLTRFESVRVRSIFRDTAYYQQLMRAACTRSALQTPATREAALCKLVGKHDDPRHADVEAAELAALRRLDVPRFTARVGGTAVDLDGRRIADWFEASGLEVVRERIRQLSESELAGKLDLLRAAYALAALEASF